MCMSPTARTLLAAASLAAAGCGASATAVGPAAPEADRPRPEPPPPHIELTAREPWTCESAEVVQMLGVLEGGSPGERSHAAEELGKFGEACVMDPLTLALQDESFAVRWSAVDALGRMAQPASVEPLSRLVHDEKDEDVQEAALQAIGWIGGDDAREVLVTQLDDHRPAVRAGAARELGELGDAAAVDALVAALDDADPAVVAASATALGELGAGGALDALSQVDLSALDDGGVEAVLVATARIGGGSALAEISTHLGDLEPPHGREVRAAVAALGWIHEPGAVVALLDCLVRPGLSDPAAAALRVNPASLTLSQLSPLLATAPREVRPNVIRLVGGVREPAASELLVNVLVVGPHEEKIAAVRAMGERGASDVVAALISALALGDAELADAVVTALGRIGDPAAVKPLLTMLEMVGPMLSSTAFNTRDFELARNVVRVLGLMGSTAAVEPLLELAEGGLSPCDELPAGALSACEWNLLAVKRDIALALGRLRDPRSHGLLERWSDDGHMWATLALGLLATDEVLFHLADLAASDDPTTRAAASFALLLHGRADALDIFLDAVPAMDEGRIESLQAWLPSFIGDDVVTAMVASLREAESWRHRLAASTVLSTLVDPRAVDALIDALTDDDNRIRAAAANALRELSGQSHGRDPAAWRTWWEAQPK
jgi:HEAT repeat protein